MFGKTFLKNIIPETISARLLAGFGFSTLVGLGLLSGYSIYYRNYTEPYKKSVCWPHYEKFYLESMRKVNVDRFEVEARRAEY